MLDTLDTAATDATGGLPPAADALAGRERLQRSAGVVSLSVKARDGRTVIDRVRQSGCGKARFPRPEPGRLFEAVLLNTSGGLTDGDTQDVDIVWGAGTTAVATTQAAERIYRSRGGAARIATRLSVGEDAFGLWLPQETIQFDGGRVRRRLEAELPESGRLLAVESTVFGRTAMGERVRGGLLDEAWRVRRGERLVFADGFRLDGDLDRQLARPAVAGGAAAIATLVFVGPEAEDVKEPVRAVLETASGRAGASVVNGVLVVRLVNADGAGLRRSLVAVLEKLLALLPLAAEAGIADRARLLPRVWSL